MPPNIVIAGFGDSGILTAAHLGAKYDITAISTKPLLVSGQELGARLSRLPEWKRDYLMPFDKIKRLDTVEILQGKVTGIQPVQNHILMTSKDGKDQKLNYDLLVIASGTRNGFWRTANMQSEVEIDTELKTLSARLSSAKQVAIVGGGPTAVSSASNLKEVYPDKHIHLFYPRDLPLRGYPEKTRKFIDKRLSDQGVICHPQHRAHIPDDIPILQNGTLSFETGQKDFSADCILWAVGQVRPNNDFIPDNMLDEDGFMRVKPTFQSVGHSNIFAIGDIAATDPNRSSARNMGYQLLAKNIGAFLSGKPQKMKPFKAPEHRWGSILGVQNEGLRIFTPKGHAVRISPWWVRKMLYPLAVDRMIYKGVRREK